MRLNLLGRCFYLKKSVKTHTGGGNILNIDQIVINMPALLSICHQLLRPSMPTTYPKAEKMFKVVLQKNNLLFPVHKSG